MIKNIPIRACSAVAILGGLVLVLTGTAFFTRVSYLVSWQGHDLFDVLSESIDLLNVGSAAGQLLLVAGFAALYATLRRPSVFATVGVVLAPLSVVTPIISAARVPMSAAASLSLYLGVVGFLVLSIAVLRERTLGRWAALPLLLWLLKTPFLTALLGILYFDVFARGAEPGVAGLAFAMVSVVLLGLGWIILGYRIWSNRGRRDRQNSQQVPDGLSRAAGF